MISGMTVSMFRSAKLHKGKKIHSNYPSVKDSYSRISDIFTRKMMQDLNYKNIDDIDEFRRISRGLAALAHYLDFKGVPE